MFFTIFQNEKTPFYAIKSKSSRTRKINIFPKKLTHGFGPKKAIFPTFFFRQFRPGKYLLRYCRTKEKKPFYTVKSKRSESRKIDVFPKGLTHGFGPKMIIFPSFFLKQFRPGKCLLRYSRSKKRLSTLQKQKVQKSEKLAFSQRG